jgi:hypothetical protein
MDGRIGFRDSSTLSNYVHLRMIRRTACQVLAGCFVVEMAGIEPASERLDTRISTSVAG